MTKTLDLLDFTGIALCLVISFLVIIKKRKIRADFDLAVLSLLIGFIIFLDVFFTHEYIGYAIYVVLQMCIAPLFFIYLKHFSNGHKSVPIWPHIFIPLWNVFAFFYPLWIGQGEEEFFDSYLYLSTIYLNLLVSLVYMILIIINYLKEKWKPASKLSRKELSWFTIVMVSVIVFTFVNFSYTFIYSVGDDNELIWLVESMVYLVTLAFLFIQAYRSGIFISGEEDIIEAQSMESRWNELFNQIDQEVRSKELFLNSLLKTEDIAKLISSNSRYVSRSINTVYGDSVTNYLNDLRLERFKKLLSDSANSHLNIDAIATECGFNSKSSFNRVFKQRMGMTPSEYRSKVG